MRKRQRKRKWVTDRELQITKLQWSSTSQYEKISNLYLQISNTFFYENNC